MRKISTLSVVLLLAFSLSGCWKVTGSKETASNVTGEVWYVKTKSIMGLIPLKSEVYYCAQPKTKGPAVCKKAKIYEPGETGYSQRSGSYQQRQPVYQQGPQGGGWEQGQQPQQGQQGQQGQQPQQGTGWEQEQQPQKSTGWEQGQQPQKKKGAKKSPPPKKRRRRGYQASPPPEQSTGW